MRSIILSNSKNTLFSIVAAAFLFSSNAALANQSNKQVSVDEQEQHLSQHHQLKKQKHERRLARLSKALDLSEEQVEQIKAFHFEVKEQLEEFKINRDGEALIKPRDLDLSSPTYSTDLALLAEQKAAYIEQKILLKGEIKAKIFEILSPEQQVKFIELQNKLKIKRALRKAKKQ